MGGWSYPPPLREDALLDERVTTVCVVGWGLCIGDQLLQQSQTKPLPHPQCAFCRVDDCCWMLGHAPSSFTFLTLRRAVLPVRE